MKGAGTTQQGRQYAYPDEQPPAELTYYRIKQTDFDGHFTNSGVIAVTCQAASSDQQTVLVYPNPASSDITIEVPGYKEKRYVEILDLSGQVAVRSSVGGKQKFSIAQLHPGTHLVKANTGDSEQSYVFVKFIEY